MENSFQAQTFRHLTLPQQLSEFLKVELLAQYEPGECLPSISQLSKSYEVSPMTLRAALSILSQQGYLDIRHGSGTYLSDLGQKQHVGLVLGLDIAQPQSFFRLHLMQYLRQKLDQLGFKSRVYLAYGGGGVEGCPDLEQEISANRVRCLVMLSSLKQLASKEVLDSKGIPRIELWQNTEYYVMPDYESFVREGVRRLAAAGRKRIAMIEWSSERKNAGGRDLKVFQQAMEEHGLEVNRKWHRGDLSPNLRGSGWSLFREIWMSEKVKPDAILVTDDMLFQGVQTAIEEMNISVPDQLMVATLGMKGSADPCVIPAEVGEVDPEAFGDAVLSIALPLLNRQKVAKPNQVLSMGWKTIAASASGSTSEVRLSEKA
ncbi:substrate-binding domain-containing protein [Puniceicoccus vermicola]|uniref:LacI family DNA-binding transcriptional regulator n=1 Tax=Puniceicoccus vermicola TaxID=388746 RepID=A0A7X1B1U7_9BACT|nr:LacI family DNA-binding transcriptional regulator [Puniceicoccus vermicola]MBC2602925.1 LacI family DNA-binding transcriptional regulator [Puniceicoccus vermicola]